MATSSGQVSVTSAGVLIVAAANATSYSAERPAPSRNVQIINNGSATVYLGASGVTTATGYALASGATLNFAIHEDEAIYGIVASTSQAVSYLASGS